MVKLSKDAKISISAMNDKEKREMLASAKRLYRASLMTPKRFQALSKALQKYRM